jgi:hypothetical protein
MNFTKIEANHVSDNQTLYDQVKRRTSNNDNE